MCAAGPQVQAQAYTVSISGTQRALFLQVGIGGMTGGSTLTGGGTPAKLGTVNTSSVVVQYAEIGTGIKQTMLSDSPVTRSAYEGGVVCGSGIGTGTGPFSTPDFTGRVYVGGLYRRGSKGADAATLTVETPLNLISTTSSANTLPFSAIEWISSGVVPIANGQFASEPTTTIPSGAFVGGTTQTLIPAVKSNTWFDNCLTFRYLNAKVVPAGTYTGTATFTLFASP